MYLTGKLLFIIYNKNNKRVIRIEEAKPAIAPKIKLKYSCLAKFG